MAKACPGHAKAREEAEGGAAVNEAVLALSGVSGKGSG
jgi:hypothetical protein